MQNVDNTGRVQIQPWTMGPGYRRLPFSSDHTMAEDDDLCDQEEMQKAKREIWGRYFQHTQRFPRGRPCRNPTTALDRRLQGPSKMYGWTSEGLEQRRSKSDLDYPSHLENCTHVINTDLRNGAVVTLVCLSPRIYVINRINFFRGL